MNHLNRILRAGLCLAIFATIIQTAIASNDAALDAERTSAIFAVPLPPIYYAPANGATGVSAPVELKFNNVAGALRYNVQVATDPGFNSIVFSTNVPHTPAVFAAPTGGVTYFWRVQTVGSSGNSTFGAAWHFTALLSPPTLLTPLNGATGVGSPVPLRFAPVPGAIRYNVQVATDAAFTTIVFKTNVPKCPVSFVLPLADTDYYWRVQSVGLNATSKFSTPWVFTNGVATVPVLASPVMLTPLNGSVNQPTTVELRFRPVDGALRYNVQVAHDAAFSDIIYATNVPKSPVKVVGVPGDLCFWRVQSVGTTETSLFSPVWKFTMTTAPEAAGQGVSSSSYALHDNYPNPFNPSTTITVDVPESGNIRVVIYDLLGHEVAELVSGTVEAGTHSYSFDASNLSSGMYLYRIESATFTQTKRMMLLK